LRLSGCTIHCLYISLRDNQFSQHSNNTRKESFCFVSLVLNSGCFHPRAIIDTNEKHHLLDSVLVIILLSETAAKCTASTWDKGEDPCIVLCHNIYMSADPRCTERPLQSDCNPAKFGCSGALESHRKQPPRTCLRQNAITLLWH
jgi:hypothetical protein